MAQLKDDCFAFSGELMSVEKALELLSERIEPVTDTETVSLVAALGRVLAEDIVAERNVPPHNNSAVDGYAVYFDDLADGEETRLPVTGRIAAGHPLGRPAKRGEVVRIFTGAPIPDGEDGEPDTVFMQEDCTAEGDEVILPYGLKRGSNRREAGEDVSKGSVILQKGRRLRAQELGLIASVGRPEIIVYKPLRVAIFSTGDEVRDPGDEAPDGCIFDSNRYTVMGLLEGLGCDVTDLHILTDDEKTITEALEKAAGEYDLLVTSGGVSVGDEDHIKKAVENLGQIDFWRLAIKPGRPIALGQIGDSSQPTAFVGLPGNPVAAMVTFMMIARPLILLLSGDIHTEVLKFKVQAGFDYGKKKGRCEWVRARLENVNGQLVAQKPLSSGAGILTSMVAADGLVELQQDIVDIEVGTMVDFIPFNEVT